MSKQFGLCITGWLAVFVAGCPDEDVCVYNGNTYDAEESFPSSDGCNSCSCDADGSVACTLMACFGTCEYDGAVYAEGETFDAADGCNTCTCEASGEASCTEKACLPGACDDGFEWFEPGCGLEDGMLEIEPGCYAACQGAPCENDLCQMTDVNPCVCAEGQDCCAACGMQAWLCLPEPSDTSVCGPFNETVPAIVSAKNSFGECMDNCVSTLTVVAAVGGGCAKARLTICDWTPADTCEADNSGVLTPLGQSRLMGAAAELIGVTLDDVYGCPDCADGGASTLTLRRDDAETSVEYEYRNPPDVLDTADGLTQGLIEALRTCTSNEDIEISSDACSPLS